MEIENDEHDKEKILWHPAFVEAIQMELLEYQDVLEFHPECQLTAGPLRIDCVVIKKAKDAVIKKNIAVIFREWNLLEYKSPDKHLSVADFYKVYAYACLYASFNKVPITSMTVSFIVSCYPKELLKHLKKERHYRVAKTAPGIYTIKGDILPIQIIDSSRLSADENLWLKNLRRELRYTAITQIGTEINRQGKAAQITAYWYAITHANPAAIKEAIEMGNTATLNEIFIETGYAARMIKETIEMGNTATLNEIFIETGYAARMIKETIEMGDSLTLEDVLIETGLVAKWEARARAEGEQHKAFGIAQNLVKLGLPIETVISATQLDPEKVKTLYQITSNR